MPKRAFDVFVPLSRVERLYSQVHKMRRKRPVSVRGATTNPPEKPELSSYMIDPKYLPEGSKSAGQQVVASTRASRPVHQYSQLSNNPLRYEATPVEKSQPAENRDIFAGGRNYLYRLTDRIQNSATGHKAKPTSHVTYTMTEGLSPDRWFKLANRTTLSVLTVTAVFLLAFGLTQWPLDKKAEQPGQTSQPGNNDNDQSRGVQAVQVELQPPPSSDNPSSVVNPPTPTPASNQPRSTSSSQLQPSSSPAVGGRGGDGTGTGGSGTQPVEDLIKNKCVTTMLSCVTPGVQPGVSI